MCEVNVPRDDFTREMKSAWVSFSYVRRHPMAHASREGGLDGAGFSGLAATGAAGSSLAAGRRIDSVRVPDPEPSLGDVRTAVADERTCLLGQRISLSPVERGEALRATRLG